MSGIMRLGFVELRVSDLARAAAFYERVLGLETTHHTDDALYCMCWDEYDHDNCVLRRAENPGLTRIGWKVERERDLDDLEKKIEGYGLRATRISRDEEAGMGEAVAFTAPSGQAMAIYHAMRRVGR